jgi:hypothetical protein
MKQFLANQLYQCKFDNQMVVRCTQDSSEESNVFAGEVVASLQPIVGYKSQSWEKDKYEPKQD